MKRDYTLKSGKTIQCWFNGCNIIVMDNSWNDIAIFEIQDKKDPTFEWEGEIIHVNNYNHISAEELVRRVNEGIQNNNRWAIHLYEAEACIKKEYKKLAFIVEKARAKGFIIPGIGWITCEDTNLPCAMIPYENRFKIDDWGYKIELKPMNDKDHEYFCNEEFYFQDLWDMVKTGKCVHLVLRSDLQ